MDRDIARDGIILYPNDADSEVLRPVLKPKRVRGQQPFESIQAWLGRIDQDLRTTAAASLPPRSGSSTPREP